MVPPLLPGSDLARAVLRIWEGHHAVEVTRPNAWGRLEAVADLVAFMAVRSPLKVSLYAEPTSNKTRIIEALNAMIGHHRVEARNQVDDEFSRRMVAGDVRITSSPYAHHEPGHLLVMLTDSLYAKNAGMRAAHEKSQIVTVGISPLGLDTSIIESLAVGSIPLDVALAGGVR